MLMQINWAIDALNDLDTIVSYIEQYSPRAAKQLEQEIVYRVSQLPDHPYLYREGRVTGTREMVVHPNYLIVYQLNPHENPHEITVLNVLHARQDYP